MNSDIQRGQALKGIDLDVTVSRITLLYGGVGGFHGLSGRCHLQSVPVFPILMKGELLIYGKQ